MLKLGALDPSTGGGNIISCYGSFTDVVGNSFLELEQLDRTLNLWKEGNSTVFHLMEIRPLVHQVGAAASQRRSTQIVHADLKMDNVLPYRVKILDFLALEVSDVSRPCPTRDLKVSHPSATEQRRFKRGAPVVSFRRRCCSDPVRTGNAHGVWVCERHLVIKRHVSTSKFLTNSNFYQGSGLVETFRQIAPSRYINPTTKQIKATHPTCALC